MKETFGISGQEGGEIIFLHKNGNSGEVRGRAVLAEILSVVGVWILFATTQSTFVVYCSDSCFITLLLVYIISR